LPTLSINKDLQITNYFLMENQAEKSEKKRRKMFQVFCVFDVFV